jgi:hypothetical protein
MSQAPAWPVCTQRALPPVPLVVLLPPAPPVPVAEVLPLLAVLVVLAELLVAALPPQPAPLQVADFEPHPRARAPPIVTTTAAAARVSRLMLATSAPPDHCGAQVETPAPTMAPLGNAA